MLLANALLQLKLGRHWRKLDMSESVHLAEQADHEEMHRNILRLFGDNFNHPLSIHSLMDVSKETFGKIPGDWFGPSATAHILQKAMEKSRENELLKNLRVYVAKDSTVYKGDIQSMCRIKKESLKVSNSFDSVINFDEYSIIDPNEILSMAPSINNTHQFEHQGYVPYFVPDCDKIPIENEAQALSPIPCQRFQKEYHRKRSLSVPSVSCVSWIPVLVLIPVKLGQGSKVNPIYASCLKSFLASENCVGIMGGKPKHSLYFVGFQVIFLKISILKIRLLTASNAQRS